MIVVESRQRENSRILSRITRDNPTRSFTAVFNMVFIVTWGTEQNTNTRTQCEAK